MLPDPRNFELGQDVANGANRAEDVIMTPVSAFNRAKARLKAGAKSVAGKAVALGATGAVAYAMWRAR